jgi:signal peptidase I
MKLFDIIKHKYFKFGLAATIYILWVIWLGNYWFLFGLPIIFDIYITEKVNWTPWKKREGKNSAIVEWLDALIFAVVAVAIINIFLFQNYKIPTGSMEKSLLIGDHLYVSKVAYGPKVPNTPLFFPFAQHTMPFSKSTKSYLEWIKLPYKRLAGLGEVQRNDAVVFNFPAGDTVVLENQAESYYSIVRRKAHDFKNLDISGNREIKSDEIYYNMARNFIWDRYEIVVRPVDRMDNYIKRCVAVAGDTIKIIDRQVYINQEKQIDIPGLQYKYLVSTNGTPLNFKALKKIGIGSNDLLARSGARYIILLNDESKKSLENFSNVTDIQDMIESKGDYDYSVFPHSPDFPWNADNFGPLYIPEKGATVELNMTNLPKYERIIDHYEDNDLEIRDSTIYINGEQADSYTFKWNYYWMMGDNRHHSADSRYWGFVPETHIVGKPGFIWLSLDQDENFPSNIRWDRMFMSVK